MDKKVISFILILIICIIVFISYYFVNNKLNIRKININNNSTTINKDDRKILIAYFSATNNTKNVALKLANKLNGDIFEIEPINKYTSDDLDWTNTNSRVSREHNDKSLQNVELKTNTPSNWEKYDTILIGYPIWWGVSAWPVDTFVKENDFNNKTVIPFCTSSSSGMGQSKELLEKLSNGGNWQKGYRFTSNPTDNDIKLFIDSIN